MHSLKLLDHFQHEKFSFKSLGLGMSPVALAVAGARGLSSAGDFVFRIVAAVSALQQTNSAALTGLIIVLPGVVGMLCRGRLAAITRISPVMVLVPMELFRASLFLFLPLFENWVAIIAVMALSGGLQAIYEGAFAGTIQQRLDRSRLREINGLVRVAVFFGALVSLVVAALLNLSVAQAAYFDGITFLVSAASCAMVGYASPAVAPPEEADEGKAASLASTRRQIAFAYFGAALGLALSAPSIVQICVAALQGIAIRPVVAYAVYEVAALIGSLLGVMLTLRLRGQLPGFQLLLMLAAINAAMLLGTLGSPILFMIGVFGSAVADVIIVVDLLIRYQSELPTTKCEEETMRFRSRLAVVACLGFAGNIWLQHYLAPITLLMVVSTVGLATAVLGFGLTGGLRRPVRAEGRSDV